ncbi:hypothetical protein J4526_07935 [Desulfurococcaceae archaeon MEX13E-LK6-19]|nr:hypothetical protein J4526_07935 [Desulfurococcaceae archaeon MEX13E-LK6-19]
MNRLKETCTDRRRRAVYSLIIRTFIHGVLSIPLAVFIYLLILGWTRSGWNHPGFWVLLFLCIVWFYLFTIEGLLCLYGLLKFDCKIRVKRVLDDCLKDLIRILDETGISYEVKRFIKSRVIKTRFGEILLVGLSPAHPYYDSSYTAIFCSKYFLEHDEFMEYIESYCF